MSERENTGAVRQVVVIPGNLRVPSRSWPLPAGMACEPGKMHKHAAGGKGFRHTQAANLCRSAARLEASSPLEPRDLIEQGKTPWLKQRQRMSNWPLPIGEQFSVFISCFHELAGRKAPAHI
jgi:hypothetical protein